MFVLSPISISFKVFRLKNSALLLLFCTLAIETQAAPLKKMCHYSQLPNQEVSLLSISCPLGEGLWGKATPKKSNSYFWIQCGVYPSPVKTQHIAALQQKLKQSIWNKESSSGYHCLIGPYSDYLSALKAQQQARKLKEFKGCELREIDLSTLNILERALAHSHRQFKALRHQLKYE